MTILHSWHQPPVPKPHLRAARDAEAAKLTADEVRALVADERCRPIADYLTRRELAYLRAFAWQWKRRRWDTRLMDS